MLVMVLLITIRMVAGNPDRRRGAAGIAIGVVAALLGDQQGGDEPSSRSSAKPTISSLPL